ncbi:hypothetical protein H2200_002153 [Cladophialophora chaetospira]|uniref:NAD(P)-binding protein n=1 Tax=Cladophialophora chaetospira TaxID=386627 RepID=A0AA39CMT5_9EURO|nr:hypothetical protein H2200_002153 [Cladophialophora chaetospira]
MADDFDIKLNLGLTLRTWLHSQFFGTPPYPTQSFAGQTIIVTGSNVGLGFEAARHFYRLNCAKLILAVRTVSKGQKAKEDIVRSVKHRSDGAEAIEIWPLDLSSTKSTLAFAERVTSELPRLDAIVENAGIVNPDWVVDEGFEQTVQVNVINTFLLALAILPKLTESKQKYPESSPHLEIVSSEAHRFEKFNELKSPDLYAALNNEKTFSGFGRYSVSKLMEVLFVRELVSRLGAKQPSTSPVTVTMVNPGMCKSEIGRKGNPVIKVVFALVQLIFARTTEVGSRTLVYGASAGPESHGEMMSDGKNQEVEKWIYSETGRRAQKKVFDQTMKILEERKPGIGAAVGL